MANKIRAQVVGGEVKDFDGVSSLSELQQKMGLTGTFSASVNGDPVDSDYELSDYEYVTFAPQVKGA